VDSVGQRLKEERQLKGWSQRDLAHETGVNPDTISGIETEQHEPRPSTLRRLAEGLGLEVRDFFREPALPKVEAPREAVHSAAQRLEDLQTYEAHISKIAEKYHTEAEPLLAAVGDADEPMEEDLDSLMTLLAQTGWTFDGGLEYLKDDDAVVEAEKGTATERRAVAKVKSALNAILHVHEAIAEVLDPHLDPGEEESRVVTHLAEYRQRRAG
jgi:transcriptional regulator with XRE-family HTH domain